MEKIKFVRVVVSLVSSSYVATELFMIIIHHVGFKRLQPPPLPSNHIHRQHLLNEIASKLLQATIIPNRYEITLTITGAGGYGKTSTAISLCHYAALKERFTDGFVFIELGPQATDPSIKLSQIYHLLTGEHLKLYDINHAEQEIKQLTSHYYHNLLVIIDDVWHVEDAEPLVKAFSNCMTILTTRMNDIEQYIPSYQSVVIGPMTQNEAISLLTNGVVDNTQLSQEDVNLLDELAQDVHLWPLLLSLIRGQLSYYLKLYHFSYHKAIQNVQTKLRHKGLTAFDKNNIETINISRKSAVKACIEMTLELLTKSSSNKIKSLILYTGIGTSLQIEVLNNLWKVSKQEAEETVNVLWAYGLIQVTDVVISPTNNTQHCVEVHAVISQYVIECMDSKEAHTLAPYGGKLNTSRSVAEGLKLIFQTSYGVSNPSSLTAIECLKYKQSEIENIHLPYYLKNINMCTITNPYQIIQIVQQIKDALMTSEYTVGLLSSLDEEIKSIIINCKEILRDAHKLCRKLNQSAQRNLFKNDYDKLIHSVEEFIKKYPVCSVAQKAVTIMKKIMPYCDGDHELLYYVMRLCEGLQLMTPGYHEFSTLTLPYIRLHIKLHKRIVSSLLKGPHDIELTYQYIMHGKYDEENDLVMTNCLIKLQDATPYFVLQKASQRKR